MFGLMVVPLTIMSVFAIDFGRALTTRTALQDAVDAAGLVVARMDPNTNDLTAKAKLWIDQNLQGAIAPGGYTLQVDRNPIARTLTLTATASVPSLAGGLTNVSTFPVRAVSTTKWGPQIELALVLDNTYSMVMNGSTKLADLKLAAANLVDTLSKTTAGIPGGLKVGVVPFSISVNVGGGYRTASWITGVQPAAYGADLFTKANTNRFTLLSNMAGAPWGGCVESRPKPYDVQDTAPSSSNPATLFVPFFSPDEEDTETWNYYGYNIGHFNSYKANSTSGADKDVNRYTNPAKYTGTVPNADSNFGGNLGPGYKVGPNMGCGVAPLQRMTSDMSVVKARLNDMVGTGETHIPVGMVWGWHVLSPNAPFSDGAPYADVASGKVTKIAVLVTDGANTYFTTTNGQPANPFNGARYKSSYTAYGYADQNRIGWGANPTDAQATTAMNDRLTKLCENMKAADKGIIIYTVPVQVTDPTIKSLLKSCATEPDNYIEVTTSKGMQEAFADIAGSITKLRISH